MKRNKKKYASKMCLNWFEREKEQRALAKLKKYDENVLQMVAIELSNVLLIQGMCQQCHLRNCSIFFLVYLCTCVYVNVFFVELDSLVVFSSLVHEHCRLNQSHDPIPNRLHVQRQPLRAMIHDDRHFVILISWYR